jgi:NtrC-family two-component system sensor histidine kinase KinB
MLEEFVITASHQLRTPVSALVQSLNNLKKYNSELNEETKEKLIDVISRNVSRLSELLEELLNFSEIEGKKRGSPFVDEFMKRSTD